MLRKEIFFFFFFHFFYKLRIKNLKKKKFFNINIARDHKPNKKYVSLDILTVLRILHDLNLEIFFYGVLNNSLAEIQLLF